MKAPPQKQIDAEIKTLNDLAPRIVQRTFFGDDNRAAIEAQIKVLEEGMDDDAIYAEWENRDDWNENRHLIGAAEEAFKWIDGEEKNPPSKDWKGLVRK